MSCYVVVHFRSALISGRWTDNMGRTIEAGRLESYNPDTWRLCHVPQRNPHLVLWCPSKCCLFRCWWKETGQDWSFLCSLFCTIDVCNVPYIHHPEGGAADGGWNMEMRHCESVPALWVSQCVLLRGRFVWNRKRGGKRLWALIQLLSSKVKIPGVCLWKCITRVRGPFLYPEEHSAKSFEECHWW